MDINNTLQKFQTAAAAHNLSYMIIGGFAASYWGEPRFTADIDYVIPSHEFEKVKLVLKDINYKLDFLHPKLAFAHFSSVLDRGFRIDFMIVDDETWGKLLLEIRHVDLGLGTLVPIVSPMHLIVMKLHSAKQPDRTEMFKDVNDIAQIMIHQNISMDDLNNHDILKKYGTEATINELKRIFERGSRKV